MKTNHLIHRERKSLSWSRNRWLVTALIAFAMLIIIGLVLFFIFSNKAF